MILSRLRNPAIGLALGRVAIGTMAVTAPRTGARLFQLDPTANPQLSYMTRLFGSREILLGVATLVSSGNAQRGLVAAGIAVDAGDALAALDSAQAGELKPSTGVLLAVPAVAAIVCGAVGVATLGRTPAETLDEPA
ncbi:DUF4267 domain-containing protein [Nocardioides limicola]|uniref:DUF4267 domain-containing protein n=1 Tax=Nocardioides limicola TaxID=2803368 RepID=UPI00193B5FD1|nr:DUF4267 domain-containing protein [Nocardioides sp. DJM-14]